MVQQIVYTDDAENEIVEKLAEDWKISKADVIKRIIREKGESNGKEIKE